VSQKSRNRSGQIPSGICDRNGGVESKMITLPTSIIFTLQRQKNLVYFAIQKTQWEQNEYKKSVSGESVDYGIHYKAANC
jgi:hypothetical protein